MRRNIKRRILKSSIFFVIVCATVIGVKFIFFPDEKERIHKTISLAISELEKKEINNFIRHFTLDYRDGFDNTYGSLYIFLKNNIGILKTINIRISQMEIEIEKSKATVRFFATASIKTTDGEFFKEAGRFLLKMRKEDFKWRIYRLDEMEYEFD